MEILPRSILRTMQALPWLIGTGWVYDRLDYQ
jgi:hypothetical protein